MQRLTWLPHGEIEWGHDILETATAELEHRGIERPLVLTVERLLPFYDQHIAPHLRDGAGVFSALPAHAPDTSIQQGLTEVERLGARSIVALGGGSVIDAAKAVSHLHHERTGRYLPIAAFPTTLSGSEFSHYFGITETTSPARFKRSYAVRDTVPKTVVLDPRLLLNTPRELLLSSAIKGIDHAVEGMRRVDVSHPHAVLASEGVERFFSVLNRWPHGLETIDAVRQGHVSHDDLLQLQLAAWHCYFFPASVVYGLSHRIGHILGGTFGVPHSVTSCITLAPVVSACAQRYGDKLRIFMPLGADGELSARSTAAGLLSSRIASTVGRLGLPYRLRDVGFVATDFPRVAALLEQNYPDEVDDLDPRYRGALSTFLESLW
ncbi:Iron-containing alcohol dehydrogenase [Pararobbsia alpina]|uniref:iron-containing alcohol dehydrogenase n=1 Tax=Pararobbsia alpina TaxID=621374 RepID=UPI0039A4ACB8